MLSCRVQLACNKHQAMAVRGLGYSFTQLFLPLPLPLPPCCCVTASVSGGPVYVNRPAFDRAVLHAAEKQKGGDARQSSAAQGREMSCAAVQQWKGRSVAQDGCSMCSMCCRWYWVQLDASWLA